jgi:hypothetical protein
MAGHVLRRLRACAQAPILLGNDLTQLDAPTLAILTNGEALAVHQVRCAFVRMCAGRL